MTDHRREDIERQLLNHPIVIASRVERMYVMAEELIARGCCTKRGDAAGMDALADWDIRARHLLDRVADRQQARRLRGSAQRRGVGGAEKG